MRSLEGSAPSVFAASACGIASRRPGQAPVSAGHFTRGRPFLAAFIAEQTRQDSWRAIEVIADTHNRRVESYLQRRRHRPWRNRGS